MKKQLLSAAALIFTCASAFGATHTVSSPADSGPGSLRDAISSATSGDIINITTNDTIKLTSGVITIGKNLTIQPQGKGGKVISGSDLSRIFTLSASYTLNINNLSLVKGSNNNGAAIHTSGTLNLDGCTLAENKAVQKGGAIYVAAGTTNITYCTFESNSIYNTQNLNTYIPHGGGVYNEGTTNISYSSFYANTCTSASWTIGGGVCNAGLMYIDNSTFSENTLKSTNSNYACIGAGIAGVDFGGTTVLDVKSCTVVNNYIITGANKGAGIAGWQAETFKINNTIVANNTFNPSGVASDVHCGQGANKTSMGYNIIASSSNFTTVSTDITTPDSYGGYDLNGGTTKNYPIECSSVAYNVGDPSLAGTVSQNGVTRGDNVDIGAYEEGTMISSPKVNTTEAVCFGESTGSATVINPNGSYTYTWSNNDVGTTMSSVAAGSYDLVTSDAGGCTTDTVVEIEQPTALAIDATVTSDNGTSSGAVDVSVTGGTPAYSYSWDNGDITEDIANLNQGNYTVTVTDGNGCQIAKLYAVSGPVSANEIEVNNFFLYPNPATDQFSISNEINVQSISVFAIDGTKIYEGIDSTIPLNNIASGSYYVSVLTKNNNVLTSQLIVK